MAYLTTVYAVRELPAGKKVEKGGKKGVNVEALAKTESVYVTELGRIAAASVKAIETLRLYGNDASWKDVKDDAKETVEFKYWTLAEGKFAQKIVDGDYITRLAMSVYSCMDGKDEKAELSLHRAIKGAVRCFRLYSRYVAVMKSNDTLARSQRVQMDKVLDAGEYGIEFGVKEQVTAASEPAVELAKAA